MAKAPFLTLPQVFLAPSSNSVSNPEKLTLPATPFSQEDTEWLEGHRQGVSGRRSSAKDLGPRHLRWAVLSTRLAQCSTTSGAIRGARTIYLALGKGRQRPGIAWG